MCDYSLHNVKSRPAKVGDKLRTHDFNTGTRGFAAPEDEAPFQQVAAVNSFTVSSRCRSLAEKWTQRRSASSGSIGTPNSKHSRVDPVALVELQHVPPLRYAQSWQTPKCRCAPLAATVVSTWWRASCIAVCSSASSELPKSTDPPYGKGGVVRPPYPD